MLIFKLVQNSWEGRQVSDFDLPKTIGYYASWNKAYDVMKNIMPLKGFNKDWADASDYTIEEITVVE